MDLAMPGMSGSKAMRMITMAGVTPRSGISGIKSSNFDWATDYPSPTNWS